MTELKEAGFKLQAITETRRFNNIKYRITLNGFEVGIVESTVPGFWSLSIWEGPNLVHCQAFLPVFLACEIARVWTYNHSLRR